MNFRVSLSVSPSSFEFIFRISGKVSSHANWVGETKNFFRNRPKPFYFNNLAGYRASHKLRNCEFSRRVELSRKVGQIFYYLLLAKWSSCNSRKIANSVDETSIRPRYHANVSSAVQTFPLHISTLIKKTPLFNEVKVSLRNFKKLSSQLEENIKFRQVTRAVLHFM